MDECNEKHIPSCMFDNITYMLCHILSHLHHIEVFNQQNIHMIVLKASPILTRSNLLHMNMEVSIYFLALRDANVIHHSIFLIWHTYLNTLWIGCGSKNIHHEDTCSKEVGANLQFILTILHSMINTIWGGLCTQSRKQHTLPMTITISWEAQIFIPIFVDVPF